MSKTVISHLLEQLKKIGITDIFGVPGDYAFPVNDAICNDPDLNWIGCCNELNGAFAADGYARIKGCSALCTTYGVGELNALGGIAGAYAEHLPIFHIVGMPKHSILKGDNIMHHTLGNGEFDLFHKMVQPVVCASSILTPENTVSEVDRLINTALTQKKPVYFGIPGDFALMELGCSKPHPSVKQISDQETLATVVKIITDKIDKAESPVAVVGTLIGRYDLRMETQEIIEKAGLPFTSMFMGKGTLSEFHPNFIGVYSGDLLADDVRKIVEESDLVVSFGTIRSDINTGAFTIKFDPIGEINIHPDHVHVGHATYHNVLIKDVITVLKKEINSRDIIRNYEVKGLGLPQGSAGDKITPDSLYPRIEKFFKSGDIIIAETGTSSMGLVTAKLPEGALFYNQTLWGSIGWATPASFGAAVAAPDRRVVLVTGEGAHQVTAQEISQFGRLGLKPVIFCLNNDGYLIERMLGKNPYIYYNEIAQWNYSKLPEAFGMEDWFTAKVTNNQELDTALEKAEKADCGCYIEIVTDKMAASEMALALNRVVLKDKGWNK